MVSFTTDSVKGKEVPLPSTQDYRLISLLGSGGYARVYLGRHRVSRQLVAIKMLSGEISPVRKTHFQEEAYVHAHLRHPHIVAVRDVHLDDPCPFFVLDYVSGGTIRQRYPKGTRLPLARIVLFVKQIAAALLYLHEQGIVHWDVKPENLLLLDEQTLVLSDFGNAQSIHRPEAIREQRFSGTVAYMAPEQLQHHVHLASDQYALGVVVYEWCTGKRPFSGSPLSVAFHHVAKLPPSFSEQKVILPSAVEAVVFKALAKDPDQRFPSVADFARALEQASLQAAPSQTYPPYAEIWSTYQGNGESLPENEILETVSMRTCEAC